MPPSRRNRLGGGRGAPIAEGALAECQAGGQIPGAVLDVFQENRRRYRTGALIRNVVDKDAGY